MKKLFFKINIIFSCFSFLGVVITFSWLFFGNGPNEYDINDSSGGIKFIFYWLIFGMVYLWLAMLYDFFNNSEIKYRVFLGFFMFLGFHIASLLYFVVFFIPKVWNQRDGAYNQFQCED